jgi:hypothetical protein
MSSDSQAMGRVGEVILRIWYTALKMHEQEGLSTWSCELALLDGITAFASCFPATTALLAHLT